MKGVRVYGVISWREEAVAAPNGNHQARHIYCGRQSDFAEKIGCSMRHLAVYGCKTGNAEEIALASSKPGVVFWRDEHAPGKPWRELAEVKRP